MHIIFYNATVHVASYVLSLVHPYSHSNAVGKVKGKVRVFISVGWKRQSHEPVFCGLWVLPGSLVGSLQARLGLWEGCWLVARVWRELVPLSRRMRWERRLLLCS